MKFRQLLTLAFYFIPTITFGFGSGATTEELAVVPSVDLNRYVGTWYEIARYPNSFQKKCFGGTTAEYALKTDGKIEVINRCHEESMNGPINEARGTAKITDRVTNAKLKVTFFWPFSGNYWIIDLDPNYGYSVVGEPSRKYLWILSRTPQLDPHVYDQILNRLAVKGYDPNRLVLTPQ